MKGIGFVPIALIAIALPWNFNANFAYFSNEDRHIHTQNSGFAVWSKPGLLFAERTETRDSIIYETDPEMERAMDEQAWIEKEKEQEAWKMLQQMNPYKNNSKSGKRKKHAQPVSGDKSPQPQQ